jgi:hypothetical protein
MFLWSIWKMFFLVSDFLDVFFFCIPTSLASGSLRGRALTISTGWNLLVVLQTLGPLGHQRAQRLWIDCAWRSNTMSCRLSVRCKKWRRKLKLRRFHVMRMFNNRLIMMFKDLRSPVLLLSLGWEGKPTRECLKWPSGRHQATPNTLDLHWKLNMGAIWMVESTWRVLMTLDDMHIREASERWFMSWWQLMLTFALCSLASNKLFGRHAACWKRSVRVTLWFAIELQEQFCGEVCGEVLLAGNLPSSGTKIVLWPRCFCSSLP